MFIQRFHIGCQYELSLRRTALGHGWIELAPWRWESEKASLSRHDPLPSGGTARIEATQKTPRSLTVTVEVEGAESVDLDHIRATVVRWLSIDWDPAPAIVVARKLDPSIGRFISKGGGRFLRCSTFFEDFTKTVCTIHTAWRATQRMAEGLVNDIGEGLFPTPLNVLEAGEATLTSKGRLGFRARVLLEATEELLRRGLIDESGRGNEDRITYEEMLELRGIGPYAATHLMVLLHDFSRIPVDSEVGRFCKERHGLDPEEIEAFFDGWGEYRFLGFQLGRIIGEVDQQ